MGSTYRKDGTRVYYEKDGRVIIDKDLDDLTPGEKKTIQRLNSWTFNIIFAVGAIMMIIGLLIIIVLPNTQLTDPDTGGPGGGVHGFGYILLLIGGSFAGFILFFRYQETARPQSKGSIAIILGIVAFLIYFVGGYFWPRLYMACFIPIMGVILIFIGVRVIQGKPTDFSYTFPWARDDDDGTPPQPPNAYYPPRQPQQTYREPSQDQTKYDDPSHLYRDDGYEKWGRPPEKRH